MVTIFWENYSKLCDSVGKSSSKVAKELGLSSGTPTPWKKDGVIPQDRILNKIAEYFHVDSKSLVSMRLFGSQYTNDEKTTRQHEADGLSDRISGLDADLQKQLIEFVELAQANPKTAKRFLSFALEELRSSAQGN